MKKIPVEALKRIAEEYGAGELVLIARFPKPDEQGHNLNIVTYGQTDEQAGFAAMAGRQLAAVLEAQPRSLQDALEVASKIRPKDVEGGDRNG
ncbi:hypothetical protein H6G00_00830 [Leptolyngbya sp. FACHB-541]|uniref:hypothetical protein n=1 Tax=Leptolyngbya sp. FACHB-541 TaxID=2692810 RepID=UPI0016870D10|nr:hypothetical protein [Leptolyngbya sp. FACHB-541]MBD1995172.1 hypothetical protein [Leptolyngbya sp. FACHB-541]